MYFLLCFQNRMSVSCFLLILITAILMFTSALYSQVSKTHFLILDFEQIGGDAKYKRLEQALSLQLTDDLNVLATPSLEVERFEDIKHDTPYLKSYSQKHPVIGFLPDDAIKDIIDSVQTVYNYIINGRFWEKSGIVHVEVCLINCPLGTKDYSITVTGVEMMGEKPIHEILSEKIIQYIKTFLTARICIGLIDFKMTGGDSAFQFLEESIPTMLATGLSVSRECKLIEIKSETLLKDMIQAGSRGIFDLTTTLGIGKKINANYLIMGEYWECGEKIRIDARCVSIETAEIVLSEYVILDLVEISTITERMNELASKIRIMIEKDFLRREDRMRSIAVIGFPPKPNNRPNQLRTDCIYRTLVRKLRLGSDLPIKDDSQKINRYMKVKEDKLKICSDLEVNYLLTVQYETIEDDRIVLDIDLYDMQTPYQDVFRQTRTIHYKTAGGFIDATVFKTLEHIHGKAFDSDNYPEITKIKLPTFLTRWSIGAKYAFLWRTDGGDKMYLTRSSGDYIELLLNYYFNDRMQIEFHVGFDTGNRETKMAASGEIKKLVWGMQMGLAFKYDLVKIFTFDLYGGLGGTFFRVFRNNRQEVTGLEDHAGDPGIGLISLVGLEIEWKKIGLSLYAEPRYIFGTKIKNITTTHIGEDIPGGRLGGFYMMIGTGYHFNL